MSVVRHWLLSAVKVLPAVRVAKAVSAVRVAKGEWAAEPRRVTAMMADGAKTDSE